MFSNHVPPYVIQLEGLISGEGQHTTSAFFSKIVKSIPGTLAGKRTPAVIPEIPAPITATYSIINHYSCTLTYSSYLQRPNSINRMIIKLKLWSSAIFRGSSQVARQALQPQFCVRSHYFFSSQSNSTIFSKLLIV